MPTDCCVPLCKNTKKKDPTLKFHRFPVDEKKCNKWIKLIRSKNFEWTMNKVICSWHFPNGRQPDSDPTRFHWNQHKNFSLNGLSLDNLNGRKTKKRIQTSSTVSMDRECGRGGYSSASAIRDEPGPALKSNCLFCRKKSLVVHHSSTPRSSSATWDKWMEQCAKSICEELNLDLSSCSSWFTSATFCQNCCEIFCNVDAIRTSIYALQLKLTQTVAKAKRMLVANFTQLLKEDARKKSTVCTAYSRAVKSIGIQLQVVKTEVAGLSSKYGAGGSESPNHEWDPNWELLPGEIKYDPGLDWLQAKNPTDSDNPFLTERNSESPKKKSGERDSPLSPSVPDRAVPHFGNDVSPFPSSKVRSKSRREDCRRIFQQVASDHSYSLTPINPPNARFLRRPLHRRLTSQLECLGGHGTTRHRVTTTIQPTNRRQVFNIEQRAMSLSIVPLAPAPEAAISECTLCGLKFSCLNEANIHQQMHHLFPNNASLELAPVPVAVPPPPTPKSKPLKKRIVKRVQKPPRRIPCGKCTLTFETPMKLRIHKAEEHATPKNPMCEHCGFQSSNYSTFKKHLGRHTKDFKCKVDNCGRAFGDKYRLKQHMLSCHKTDVPPLHTCTSCKKDFYSNSKFKQHMECHGEERKYKCHLCPQAFKTHSCLWVHVNINHKKNPNGLNSKRSRPRKGRLPKSELPPPPPSAETELAPVSSTAIITPQESATVETQK